MARAAVTAALKAGKPVVTANKALLARHGIELATLAEKRGVAEQAGSTIDGVEVVLIRASSNSGQLYGSVSARDIVDALIRVSPGSTAPGPTRSPRAA